MLFFGAFASVPLVGCTAQWLYCWLAVVVGVILLVQTTLKDENLAASKQASIASGTYHFEQRSKEVSHGHPVLVFDRQNRLHLALTVFVKAAVAQLSISTVRVYLYAILPYFTFLEVDEWQVRAGRRWDINPEEVRYAVNDYLAQSLSCKVREHKFGFQLVTITKASHRTVSTFLSGIKLFYRVMQREGYYSYNNPLIDTSASVAIAAAEILSSDNDEPFPQMPAISGVTESHHSRRRLSDSYFRLQGDEWIPQVIDDPEFRNLILQGGSRVSGWGIREDCVTNLLFESGGRISEITGLTLGDWEARGMHNMASAFSKGSEGKRVKFLHFTDNTAKLLRRYFNTERRKHDPQGYSLGDYLRLAKHKQVDLISVPLFITTQGTQLTPKAYRDNYWKRACKAAGIDADVHQARHWYVTMAIRLIYETSSSSAEIADRKKSLIAYMKWQSEETINAYEHYFSALRHAEWQEAAIARREKLLKQDLERRRHSSAHKKDIEASTEQNSATTESEGFDFNFIRQIGGGNDD